MHTIITLTTSEGESCKIKAMIKYFEPLRLNPVELKYEFVGIFMKMIKRELGLLQVFFRIALSFIALIIFESQRGKRDAAG